MKTPVLYRKRLIPDECLRLENDRILFRDDHIIVTSWNTIRPKKTLHHGLSCYFLKEGVKVSKFYNAQGELLNWYCDIISYTFDPNTDTYVFTDLLADVIIYPDGTSRVVDLDELADAYEHGLLSSTLLQAALRQLDWLLGQIYHGGFPRLQACLEQQERCLSSP